MPYFHLKYYLISLFFLFVEGNAYTENYHSFTSLCMGSQFSILIDDENKSKCDLAAQAAFKEANRINLVCSDYDSMSEVSMLSASSFDPEYIPVSEVLWEILTFSNKLAVESDGAFDITIGPASRLWRIARFRNKLPAPDAVRNTLQRIGYRHIQTDPSNRSVSITQKGMVLDLGGIAKGYAADKMLQVIQSFGLSRCLIDAGGDIVLGMAPRNHKGWKIKIGGKNNLSLPTLTLANCSIATSGDWEQYIELGGVSYSHIIDPRTGMGITNRSQVTVITKKGMTADALASTFSVLGYNDSIDLLKKYGVQSAFFITYENDTLSFKEFKGG